MPNLRNGSKGGFEPGLSRLRVRRSTTELPLSRCRSLSAVSGREREGGRPEMGHHVSLTNPVLRQYHSEYYQIAHPESLPVEERVLPSTPWSVSSADSITTQSVSSEVRVKITQLRDWEMLARASLGVVNHLDWFSWGPWGG